MARGGDFRDGTYRKRVFVGKRTVKEGEVCAIWNLRGEHKLVVGPRRRWIFMSDVRFLDRYTADQNQYLVVVHKNGMKEHLRGPLSMHLDPVHHQQISVDQGITLENFEAVIVYREIGRPAPGPVGTPLAAKKAGKGQVTRIEGKKAVAGGWGDGPPLANDSDVERAVPIVERRVIRGPTLFFPAANEWIHSFSWHGAVPASKRAGGTSPTSNPSAIRNGDWNSSSRERGRKSYEDAGAEDELALQRGDKAPHQLKFTKLNLTPKQLYYDVRGVRTADDAQINISLMLFYTLTGIERMLDTTQDPIGDFINAISADVMSFAAEKSYEQVLASSAALSDVATFPILAQRAQSIGFTMDKVVYRGLHTSSHLQELHNKSVTNATKLRLDALDAEQEQKKLDLESRRASEREDATLRAEAARADERRALADKEHEQRLRHLADVQRAELEHAKHKQETELTYLGALAQQGVDLTQLLVAREESRPTQHIRVDGAAAQLAKVHIAGEPAPHAGSARAVGSGAGTEGSSAWPQLFRAS